MNRSSLTAAALSILFLLCPVLAPASDGTEEARLIAVLQSGSSLREKDAACSQLKRIGTKESVPALAALLTDNQLSHSARYALESMPTPEAGAALLKALAESTGLNKIGIIQSLGVRKETAAISALGKLLSDSDAGVVIAATEALGQIGGAKALRALESAPSDSTAAVNDARTDALLMIANELLTHDEAGAAHKVFQRIYDGSKKENIRLAAFRGLILSSGKHGLELVTEAIAGTDGPRQSAALRTASSIEGAPMTAALTELLSKAPAPVQIALLQCLAQRGDGTAMTAVVKLTDSADADVRLAAISALGELGDGSAVLLLARIAAETTGAERTASRQSLLDLRRGNVTDAMTQAVGEAQPKVQQELLRALGTRGDKSALPKLIGLAHGDDEATRAASYQALALLAGPPQISSLIQLVIDSKNEDARSEAAEALGVAYQRIQAEDGHVDVSPLAAATRTAPLEARLSLLAICGGLNAAEAREALRAAATDSDARVREAAIRAECDTHDVELLPDLIRLAHATEEKKFRSLAIGGCVRLTTQEEGVTMPADAKLNAFKTILDGTLDAVEKRLLLSGIGTLAGEQPLAMAVPMLDDTEVRPEASRAVIQIAATIAGSQPETAGVALKRVLDVSTDPATRQAAETGIQHIKEMASYITAWEVAGPYTQQGKDYAALFDIAFPPEDPKNETVKWQSLAAGVDPAQLWKMDLLHALGGEQRVAYARTWIYSPDELPVRLEIGADDGVKVWFNGKFLHGNNASRGLQPGSDKVDVTLQRGWNPLLLKITQNTLGWEFCVRVTGLDGAPIVGVRASGVPPS